jgi:hypothetical protein
LALSLISQVCSTHENLLFRSRLSALNLPSRASLVDFAVSIRALLKLLLVV